ncbi:MAG: hypothetical protein O9248_00725 [Rhodobacteraceae bacterium]|nr:hypothetical protein [Paracoccaceae bacterium]
MGMKSKVRSMQRGAQKRSTEPRITNADLYRQSPPLLTDDELAHFKFGNRSINDFFLGLEDILLACHKSHLAAAEVSKVLNKKQARTACGAQWTPRLAWFLMKTWRTIHFQKLELEREKRKAQERQASSIEVRSVKDSPIERAVERQKADTFQKVLRSYFKNPTLGEIFPELGALKRALLGAPEEPAPSPDAQPVVKPNVDQRGLKKKPVTEEYDARLSKSVQFSGAWQGFFSEERGRDFLSGLVRTHPKLLELASTKDVRFLGHLRARKAQHPDGKYWIEADAEQVRLAILTGLHKQTKS